MGIFDKAKDLAGQHGESIGQGIEKAGDFFDEKTGGRFAEQVDQAQDFAKGQFGGEPKAEPGAPGAEPGQPGAEPQPGEQPPR